MGFDSNNDDVFDDDMQFVLTPWGCLASVLEDYGIDISRVKSKIGGHIVDDFMELMERAGYVVHHEEGEATE